MPETETTTRLQAVAQRHLMSCGLACVASITNAPYEAVVAGEPLSKLNGWGFLCPELVAKLAEYGHSYAWKKLEESERDAEFAVGDIVFVEPSRLAPGGHFLAKTPDGWMDPWINFSLERPYIAEAEAGFRDTLPGRAEYLVYSLPTETL